MLACASRLVSPLWELHSLERSQVECDLTFNGFIVMENKLKPITSSIIQSLQKAEVRPVMVFKSFYPQVTGDNILTAISVGRQCNIITKDEKVYLADLIEDELEREASSVKIRWNVFESKIGTTSDDNGFQELSDSPENQSTYEKLAFPPGCKCSALTLVNDESLKNSMIEKNPSLLNKRLDVVFEFKTENDKSTQPSPQQKFDLVKNGVKINEASDFNERIDEPWTFCDKYALAITGK